MLLCSEKLVKLCCRLPNSFLKRQREICAGHLGQRERAAVLWMTEIKSFSWSDCFLIVSQWLRSKTQWDKILFVYGLHFPTNDIISPVVVVSDPGCVQFTLKSTQLLTCVVKPTWSTWVNPFKHKVNPGWAIAVKGEWLVQCRSIFWLTTIIYFISLTCFYVSGVTYVTAQK